MPSSLKDSKDIPRNEFGHPDMKFLRELYNTMDPKTGMRYRS